MRCSLLILLVAVAACDFTVPSGRYICDTTADCPPGQSCSAGGLCVDGDAEADAGSDDTGPGADGGATDTGDVDAAGSDADVPQTCSADTCSGHGTCDDSSGTALCTCQMLFEGAFCERCIPGFVDSGAGTCVYVGLLNDSGFDDVSAWTVEGSAEIDAGRALISPEAACDGGRISQTVTIPPSSLTGSLALVFSVREIGGAGTLAVLVDGQAFAFDITNDFQEVVYCLDESLAGRTLDIVLEPFESNCDLTGTVQVEDMQIVEATLAQCPAVASVPNGDFEAGDVGWTVSGMATVGAPGIHGGNGALVSSSGGSPNSISTDIYVPTPSALPNPAIALWHNVPSDFRWGVRLGEAMLGAGGGVGVGQESIVCIPPWLWGTRQRLSIILDGAFDSAELDDIRMVSEPACVYSPTPPGGDMEDRLSVDWVRPYFFGGSDGRMWILPTEVTRVLSPAEAHTGSGTAFGEIAPCAAIRTGVSFTVPIPRPTATAGPAVSFFYRSTDFTGVARLTTGGGDLTPSLTWVEATVCLDPREAGRWTGFSVQLYYPSSSCPGTNPAQSLYVDDIVVGTDPSCPTE